MSDTSSSSSWTGVYEDDAYDYDLWNDYVPVILTRACAVISMVACVAVAGEAGSDILIHRRGSSTSGASFSLVIVRTQLVLQFPLFVITLVYFVGNWAVPQGTPGWGSRGSIASCEVMGFLLSFCVVLLFFLDSFNSLVHVLMVRYNWKDAILQKMEKWVHMLVWPLALGQAIFLLVRDMYNNAWDVCGVYQAPFDCEDDDSSIECVRGQGASIYLIIQYVCLFLVVGFSIFSMASIYWYVRHTENRVARYTTSTSTSMEQRRSSSIEEDQSRRTIIIGDASSIRGTDNNRTTPGRLPRRNSSSGTSSTTAAVSRRRSRAVAAKGIRYAGATVLTYMLHIVEGILWILIGEETPVLLFLYIASRVSVALGGFFNSLVFFYNRPTHRTTLGAFYYWILSGPSHWCSHCCKEASNDDKNNDNRGASSSILADDTAGTSGSRNLSNAAQTSQDDCPKEQEGEMELARTESVLPIGPNKHPQGTQEQSQVPFSQPHSSTEEEMFRNEESEEEMP